MEDKEQPSLKSVMALLGTLNGRLDRYETRLDGLTADGSNSQTFFTGLAEPSTSRSSAVRQVVMDPSVAAPYNFPEVTEEIQSRVASWLRGALALFIQTDENTSSEDDQAAVHMESRLSKSGKLCTADTVATKKITWPHEVEAKGSPPSYNEMGAVLSINGYLTVMGEETGIVKGHMLRHLQELMEDASTNGVV